MDLFWNPRKIPRLALEHTRNAFHLKHIPITSENEVFTILGRKTVNIRVMAWIPSGPYQGFPCPHDQAFTMAHFLEIRD
jgi:homospermidine synthase